jgi:ribosomal protein S18 acetylase RimI-like enzyme
VSQGWQLRPAGLEDLPAIVALVQAEDLKYRGHTDFSLGEVREQIAADRRFDVARDQIAAECDGQLIASAIVTPRAAITSVHPDHDEERLRVELLAWAEHRMTELGRQPLRVAVPAAYTPAVDFLRRAGYRLERFYAQMVREFARTGPPEAPEPVPGYRLRPIDRTRDVAALHALDDRAFRDRPDYQPESLETYDRRHIAFSHFEPGWSLLAETADGRPAASLVGWRPLDHAHGYVAVLAVDPEHRRRGLARALLLSAFGAIHAAGLPTAELHVASDNPRALDLYLGVGMREHERFEHYVRSP